MITGIPRLMIAGGGSGTGKTTVACALLLALKKRGRNPAAFKCGPDYIDPLFHAEALQAPSCNLDSFLCGEEVVKYLFARHSKGADIAVVEGVMGVYDGMGQTQEHSSNTLAGLLAAPQVLVVNAGGQSLSLVAQIYGYLRFLPNRIRGILLNRASEKMYPRYKAMVEEHLDVKVYGYLPSLPDAVVKSRQLGLIIPEEIDNIREKLNILAETALRTMDVQGLATLAGSAEPLTYAEMTIARKGRARIAVARDKAFCFHYRESLAVLQRMGAELCFFSPLSDPALPENCAGLILGGGYPEEHAARLSGNRSMLLSVKTAVEGGMPTLAECGGYAYLCRSLQTGEGISYPMAGVLAPCVHMTGSLRHFGYITLVAEQDSFLCAKGAQYKAHEFHYSDSSDNGSAFTAVKADGTRRPCCHAYKNLLAGYPHLHLGGNIPLAEAFMEACLRWKKKAPPCAGA